MAARAMRPQSAPVLRGDAIAAAKRLEGGERLLLIQDLLKDEHLVHIGAWWAALPVVARARGRWVFHEPDGLSHPRQRARREILDVPSLDGGLLLPPQAQARAKFHCVLKSHLCSVGAPIERSSSSPNSERIEFVSDLPNPVPLACLSFPSLPLVASADLDLPEDQNVERHNKSQHFRALKGPGLHAWKEFCLRSTNQEFQKVPEPDPNFGPSVWFRMFRKSHGGLLRPGALELVEKWVRGATDRQKAAVSELLWTFNDHLVKLRGNTTTSSHYGPKQGELATINLIDPFGSALGRPSSAPIASSVQRKFERQKREAEAAMVAKGQAARDAAKSGRNNPFDKREMDTLKSTIPLKMGAPYTLESSTQRQMATVKPKDLMEAIKWGKPTIASCPPASNGMGRHLGGPEWHGDSMYKRFWPNATKAFQPLDTMRRPHDIPGWPEERMKKFVA